MHGYGMQGWNMNWDVAARGGADHRSRPDITGTQVKSVCSTCAN